MPLTKHINNLSQWFLNDLTSRIIAKSGIPTDRYHLGKIVLQGLKDDTSSVLQIDGATGESESCGSVLKRSIQCAIGLRNLGLQTGDVILLMAPNHIDLCIPFYAALYLGIGISPIDWTLGVEELQDIFNVNQPKVIFCQREKVSHVQTALDKLGSDAKIIPFSETFHDLLAKNGDDIAVDGFKPSDFNPEETMALLIPTSGTTGPPKAAALTHKNFAITIPNLWVRWSNFPTPTRLFFLQSPLQWLTALLTFIVGPVYRYPRLQTSLPLTTEHTYYLINTYRPTVTIISPTLMTSLIKPGDRDQCDFTCLESIFIGGSAVPHDLLTELKKISPNTLVTNVYGLSEVGAITFDSIDAPPNSSGKPSPCFDYKIVSIESGKEITEPNVPGELWLKGLTVCKGYYKNIEATKEAFTNDGWLKTGDMFYRDEHMNYYFVERIKLLLKYRNHQISPVEVENVIRQHPGVQDVAVTGIPDPEFGDLPVACVVLRPGFNITKQEIMDLVKDSLAETKQLRGGVVFMSALPMTATTKLHRRQLKAMVLNMKRE